jgi:hypothetical protein
MRKRRIKYVSLKLPACGTAYPLDRFGCRKLPPYNADYLKKHGKKLFDILMHKVPATVYSELVRCIREKEKF